MSDDYTKEDAYVRAFSKRLNELSMQHHGVPAAHLQYTQQHALAAIVYSELGVRTPGGARFPYQQVPAL